MLKDSQIAVDSQIVEQANWILSDWRTEAEGLVSEHWPNIQRVAAALLTANMLAEVELDRLIAATTTTP
jgi:hypothetical protein